MNATLPIGHRDPRTELVAGSYLRLAADLVTSERQDLKYWDTVPIPTCPTDRVAFEELRQFAVFLPLVFVTLAFFKYGYIGAVVVFFIVLPVMALLNKILTRAICAKGKEMRERDGGRYAFTTFMCREFDLRPQDVTMQLVRKMCQDLKLWVAIENLIHERDKAEERARKAATKKTLSEAAARGDACDNGVARADTWERGAAQSKVWGNGSAFMDSCAALTITDAADDPEMMFNPATGLQIVGGGTDVHGNVYGTSNVDDMFDDVYYDYAVDTSFTNVGSDFYTPDFGGFTPDFGGSGVGFE